MKDGEKMATAAIALGSNLTSRWGSPADALWEATRLLGRLGDLSVLSSLRETEPLGYTDQPRFVNAAALLQTHLEPLDLLRGLLAIESEMGRMRAADQPPKGPRIIDLDLLLYCDQYGEAMVFEHPELHLPHPAMHLRGFVLEPLAEIAPSMRHPVLCVSVAKLWGELSEQS